MRAYGSGVPVEFLSDREVAAYGCYAGTPSPAELDRFFFLDDADKVLVRRRRGDHHRLGFALQLTTVRFVGTFLADPLDVPDEVVIYLAKQLDIDVIDQLGRYTDRRSTRFEHQEEIRRALGLTNFSDQVEAFTDWLDAVAFNTGDGPHALFAASVDYLREHRVVLPGVSTLARLVARVREEATARLHSSLCADLTTAERVRLDQLLVVADGERVCELERWRKGVSVPSGKNLEKALKRAGEITASGLPALVGNAAVPRRRLLELARSGMAAKATALRRQPATKRWATVAATVAYLQMVYPDSCSQGPQCASGIARLASGQAPSAHDAATAAEQTVATLPGVQGAAVTSEGPTQIAGHSGYQVHFAYTHANTKFQAATAAVETGPAASGTVPTSLIFVHVSDRAGAPPASVVDQIIGSAQLANQQK